MTSAAAPAIAAVSARSTWGPSRSRAGPSRSSADDVSAAASSGSKPPSGPTTSTHSPTGRRRDPGDLLAGGIGDDEPGAAAQLRHRQHPLDLGHRARRHWAAACAIRRRRVRAASAASTPTGYRTTRRQQRYTVDAELGELLHREVGLRSLRERQGDDQARFELRLDHRRALGVEVDHTGPDAHDGIGAPTPVAVGGRERLAGADTPNSAQVMPGVVVERDVVVERGQEGVRGRRVQGRESRHYWKAERTRSKNPRSGGADFLAAQLGELTEQLFLLRAQLRRHLDVEAYE